MDGQYQSNTLYREQNLNWTGLLLEPDLGMFQLLQRKNRKAWSANVCLSPHYYPYKVVQNYKYPTNAKYLKFVIRITITRIIDYNNVIIDLC